MRSFIYQYLGVTDLAYSSKTLLHVHPVDSQYRPYRHYLPSFKTVLYQLRRLQQ